MFDTESLKTLDSLAGPGAASALRYIARGGDTVPTTTPAIVKEVRSILRIIPSGDLSEDVQLRLKEVTGDA